MLIDTRPTVRLPRMSAQQWAVLAQVTEARKAHYFGGSVSIAEHNRIQELRTLAADGHLATTAGTATPAWRSALSGAAFAVVWPVVFGRLTRKVELARGHTACASSVMRMAGDCLDHFYDDVEAVVGDLLTHATVPIRNLESWIASRLNAVTVDAYRRRRGQIGALQRPRLPRWLSDELGDDPWLVDLAVQMLHWVGVRATAGAELWPLDSWVPRRAMVTGDPATSDPGRVARDIEVVLVAMRTRPEWYMSYIERPLGHKQPPPPLADDADRSPLLLIDQAQTDDAHMLDLAGQALRKLKQRLTAAQNPTTAVREVLRGVFGAADVSHGLDRRPLDTPDYDQQVMRILEDSGRVDLVIAAVRQALADARDGSTEPPAARGPSPQGAGA